MSVEASTQMFTGMRGNSLNDMQPQPKVAWVDVPESLSWFFGMHWNTLGSMTPRMIAKFVVLNNLSLEKVKAAFSFFAQHHMHSFTHYESKGVTRYRMTKKPFVCVEISWNKRGIASTIQSNEVYMSKSMKDGGLKAAQDIVFSLLPKLRMEGIVLKDTNMLAKADARRQDLFNLHTKLDTSLEWDIDDLLREQIDATCSVRFTDGWLAFVFTGSMHKTYTTICVRDLNDHAVAVDVFKTWLHGEEFYKHEFSDTGNAASYLTVLAEFKGLMAECLLKVAALRERRDALYTHYGLTDIQEEE